MKTKLVVVSVFALAAVFQAGAAWGFSDLELREKWSQFVVNVKNSACSDENKRRVVKKLDYAAVLIMHNEVEEAKAVMNKAADAAESARCKKAISKGIRPPG